MFDFPAAPTSGQEYTPSGGSTYIWNNYAWAIKPAPTTGVYRRAYSYTSETLVVPAIGEMSTNGWAPMATVMRLSSLPKDGTSFMGAFLMQVVKPGTRITMLKGNDTNNFTVMEVTGPATEYAVGDYYYDIPVKWIAGYGSTNPVTDLTLIFDISGGGGGASTIIGASPPATPTAGQLWWESDTGILFIWYDDGNTSQWVQAALPVAADLSGYLPLTGGTLSNNLTINKTVTGSAILKVKSTVANQHAYIQLDKAAGGGFNSITSYTDGVARWAMHLSSITPETGANAGSNFDLRAYSDTGTYLGSALTIERATRKVTIGELIAGSAAVPATLLWSDDGATVGPVLKIERISASPAAAYPSSYDLLGGVEFWGSHATAGQIKYAGIQSFLYSTASNGYGGLQFSIRKAGVDTLAFQMVENSFTVFGGISANGGSVNAADYVSGDYLRSNSTGDASATSTTHGLQIGLTSGINMRMDNNEIIAVNNGVLASLYLNSATVGPTGAFTTVGAINTTSYMTCGPTDSSPSTAAIGHILNTNGYHYLKRSGTGNQSHTLFMNNAAATPTTVGTINTNGSATSYLTSSDEFLKTFTGLLDPDRAINILRADPPREFDWNDKSASPGVHAVGWGAQTSYTVSPDLATPPPLWEYDESNPDVTEEPKPGDIGYHPWSMDFAKRVPYLAAALLKALDLIDELTARIVALEGAA